MSAKINKLTAFAAKGISLMDRVQGNGGANITQASITSIAYTVTRYSNADDAEECKHGTTVITAGVLLKATVVFDTLQTAAPWNSDPATGGDATGYNFRYDSPAADRPAVAGGGTYWHRYDIVFTPASGAAYALVWIVETLPMQ